MSLSSYYRQYDKQNLAELERQKEALRQMSETQKQLVNENADASIKQIEETGNANIREAEHAYDGVINTANVQKLINERQVAERMANLGMTDSGLNRTQQTAVQLSHSNSVNRAMVARQKQIDALALAINQQIGQVNIQRKTDLTNLDLAHQQNLYGLDEQYRANRDSWASSAYDADQARAAAEYKAKLEHDENLIKLGLEAEETAAKNRQAQLEDRAELIEKLYDKKIDPQSKVALAQNYNYKYGNDSEINSIVANIGIYDEDGNEIGKINPFGKYYGNQQENTSWDNGKTGKYAIPSRSAYQDYYGVVSGTQIYNGRNSPVIQKGTKESDTNYAQRVADATITQTPDGKKFVNKYGSPTTTKYSKQRLEKAIWDLYESGEITEGVALSLARVYGI